MSSTLESGKAVICDKYRESGQPPANTNIVFPIWGQTERRQTNGMSEVSRSADTLFTQQHGEHLYGGNAHAKGLAVSPHSPSLLRIFSTFTAGEKNEDIHAAIGYSVSKDLSPSVSRLTEASEIRIVIQ